MNLSWMKEFLVLSETGNYLAASGQLYIAQSSLSRHIKAMEEELGVLLFKRTTRTVTLSEFGEIFLPYAQKITELETQYQFDLFQYKRKINGALSIGSIPSMAQYGILDLFACFRQTFPQYSLDIMEGDSTELMERLQGGEIDLAFVRTSPDTKIGGEFEQIPYAEDFLSAIIPVGHPLSRRKGIRMDDLKEESLLLLSSDTFMFQLCLSACQRAHFEPKIGFTGRKSGNLLLMTEKGFGIALLTQNPIQEELTERLVLIPIEPKIEANIQLIYPKDGKLSAPAREFLSMLRQKRPSA